MSSPTDADEAVIARARDAMIAVRQAEHALLAAVGELAESGAWEGTGHRRLGRFLEELWRIDPAHGRRFVRHAEHTLTMVALSGQTVAPRLPRAASLAAAGQIGDEHLRVLVRARSLVERIPGIAPDRVAEAEELLAEAARSLPPCGLQRVLTQLLATLDPDGVAPEEEPEPIDELLVTHRRDGTLAFTGRVHGVADVELLLETLDVLAAPAGPDDPRNLAQRRAEALLDLCGQARGPDGIADEPLEPVDPFGEDPRDEDTLDDIDWRDQRDEDSDSSRRHGWLRPVPDHHNGRGRPTTPPPPPARTSTSDPDPDPEREHSAASPPAASPAPNPESESESESEHSPASAVPAPAVPPRRQTLPVPARAQIALTISLDWLRERTGHALLDSGRPLDPATARRLACDANLIPAVLGTRSDPVELGRAAYAVNHALRRLLVMRDRGCAHPGCTRRPNRTHAHHIRHWVDGGPTDPDNLVLPCRYHHHLVHHGGWDIEVIDGRPWFTPPRWTDPHRRPIPGGASLPAPRTDAA